MPEEHSETQQLNTGWRVILVIWGAMFVSLGVYLVVAVVLENYLHFKIQSDFPMETLRYALFGISCTTLFVVYFLRQYLLKNTRRAITSPRGQAQHPAVARYTVITVLTSALLESIGIYGLVLFLLSRDFQALYGLMALSALGMLFFRPHKNELFEIAELMKA